MTLHRPSTNTWAAFVGLGASEGPRLETLRSACAQLRIDPACTLVASSRVYLTHPVGAATQPFMNAAVHLRCAMSPSELLVRLLEIEHAHGRVRRTRWSDRSLDLDLLAGLDERGLPLSLKVARAEAPLELPHPRAHQRDFVLAPLCELAPDLRLAGHSVRAHLGALPSSVRTIFARQDRLVSSP